jgi:hypothetical protein
MHSHHRGVTSAAGAWLRDCSGEVTEAQFEQPRETAAISPFKHRSRSMGLTIGGYFYLGNWA